ncbi:putative sodium-coupled neutral amino acid transporter 11 isoform X1 [Hypanus sabinus]|uniref:putative sodium-coupled neutral amino acid transporter 11 isoform X1 n=1 Tax=Hypanus sabinus TaxID=79690 RepID=UPI0028C39D49|nr:putative sodium-coupled neutral amino acid transporter 11 isoform X1 [Hypanus sabinus]
MRQAGLPFGILLLTIVAYVTDYSSILLIKGGNLSGTNTYQCLVNKAFGLKGYMILSILQFLYPFIIGPENILAERHFVIAMTTLVFVLPLSMYRNIANLGKLSLVSLVLTLAILVIVVVEAATLGPKIPPSEGAWNFAQSNAMQAIGIMAFAFVSHHNTFLIYGSLETPTINNWSCVSHISVLFSLITYLIFAGSAYGTFTGYTQGDLFENYCKNDDWATIGRLLYGLTTILTYPIECFVVREVIANFFFNGTLTTIFHVVVTFCMVAVAMAISQGIECLEIVLVLNGVIVATPLVFIIPTACYIKLSEKPWKHWDNLKSWMILITGAFVMIFGFVMAIMSPQACSHGEEMFYCKLSSTSAHNITVNVTVNNSPWFKRT